MKKGKIFSIDDLNVMHSKYNTPLNFKDIAKMAVIPGLYTGILLYIVFFRIWLIPFGIGVGVVYSLSVMIPNIVKMQYRRKSFRERNRFINNMSQSLHRKNATIFSALVDVANNRLSGELREDIIQLAARVDGDEEEKRKEAYDALIVKYSSDRIFVQYIEHLMTLDFNGKENMSAIDETAESHDKSLEMQERLIDAKTYKIQFYIVTSLLSIGLMVFSIYIVKDTHIKYFAHSIIGFIFGIVYLAIHFFYNHKCVMDYTDEEVMQIRF